MRIKANIIIVSILVIITFATSDKEALARERSSGKRASFGSYKSKSYKKAKAIDGDTFRYRRQRYRIQQYNAPEIGKPGSQKATRSLQHKIDSGKYKWKPIATDAYGRTIVKEQEK